MKKSNPSMTFLLVSLASHRFTLKAQDQLFS